MTELFSDGFESGDLSAWTDTQIGTGGAVTVESTNPHHGTYNEQAVCDGTDGTWAACYKTFAGEAIAYARYYVKFNSIDITSNTRLEILALDDGGYQERLSAILFNDGGTIKWGIRVVEGGVGTNHLGTHTPVVDTWYCVEIKRNVTNNQQELWIDGVSEVSATVTITSNSTTIRSGIVYQRTSTSGNTHYCDCVVVADAYIGPEAEGGQQLFTLINMMEY